MGAAASVPQTEASAKALVATGEGTWNPQWWDKLAKDTDGNVPARAFNTGVIAALLAENKTQKQEIESLREQLAEKESSSHEEGVDKVLLPAALASFELLSETPSVVTAIGDTAAAQKLQEAVRLKPNDKNAAARLQAYVETLRAAYTKAIDSRVKIKGIFRSCFEAIDASNTAFKGVYGEVWQLVGQVEAQSFDAFKATIADTRKSLPVDKCVQLTSDLTTLFQGAATAKPLFDRFVREVVEAVKPEFKAIAKVPTTLKKARRVVEKAELRHGEGAGDCSRVCDVVRAMIVVRKLEHVRRITAQIAARPDVAVIVRIKERFFEAPSPGGWRDVMINLVFVADKNSHVCEIQVVHELMLSARKGLPGHAVYGRARNAGELLEKKYGAAVAGDMIALGCLHVATGGGKALGMEGGIASKASWDSEGLWGSINHNSHVPHVSEHEFFLSDKGWLSDAPLQEWTGVSVDAASGRVVGLELKDMGFKGQLPPEIKMLSKLAALDLRQNPQLQQPAGLSVLGLLDSLTEVMLYTDLKSTQALLAHIALSDHERTQIVRDAVFTAKYGPDGHLLKTLFDNSGGFKSMKQHRWFDRDDNVGNWHGVNLDPETKRLVTLDLAGLKNVTDASLSAFHDLTKQRSIDLEGCVKITDAGLSELAKHCPQLQSLNLKSCKKITDAGLSELAKHCPQLQSINLDSNLSGHYEITDAGVSELAKHCPQLQSIDLSYCDKITDAGVSELAKHCPQLQILSLRNYDMKSRITDAGLIELAKHCPQLQSINLDDCQSKDAGLSELAKHCPQLQSISLEHCWYITDAGLSELAKHCPQLHPDKINSEKKGDGFLSAVAKHHPQLQRIKLGKATDAGVIELSKHCTQLQSIDLSSCDKITDAGVSELAKHCTQLQSIYLGECKTITNAVVSELAKHCPQLHSFDLAAGDYSSTSTVNDTWLNELAKHCPKLQSLNLSHCNKITDAGVIELAKHCTLLQSLNLNSCGKITDVGVSELAKYCPKLQSIRLVSCSKVTDAGLGELAKHCPDCKVTKENKQQSRSRWSPF